MAVPRQTIERRWASFGRVMAALSELDRALLAETLALNGELRLRGEAAKVVRMAAALAMLEASARARERGRRR